MPTLLAGILSSGCIGLATAADSSNESALKVAFLFNFFKFIDWPEASVSKGSYTLCLANTDSLGESIGVLKNKTINNKPLMVVVVATPKEVEQCQMLYLSDLSSLNGYLKASQNRPIVTVSDQSDFIQQGGQIGLLNEDNHLGFEINLDAANAGGLHFNSQLLKLAKTVIATR